MVRAKNTTKIVDNILCEDAGLNAPSSFEKCGNIECPRWETGAWSSCQKSKCFAMHVALQKRDVKCTFNGATTTSTSNSSSTVPYQCDDSEKPTTKQECYNELCKGVWRVEQWSEVSFRFELFMIYDMRVLCLCTIRRLWFRHVTRALSFINSNDTINVRITIFFHTWIFFFLSFFPFTSSDTQKIAMLCCCGFLWNENFIRSKHCDVLFKFRHLSHRRFVVDTKKKKISVTLHAMEKVHVIDCSIVYGMARESQLGMHVIINHDQLLWRHAVAHHA